MEGKERRCKKTKEKRRREECASLYEVVAEGLQGVLSRNTKSGRAGRSSQSKCLNAKFQAREMANKWAVPSSSLLLDFGLKCCFIDFNLRAFPFVVFLPLLPADAKSEGGHLLL
jgi:hypothetical protein